MKPGRIVFFALLSLSIAVPAQAQTIRETVLRLLKEYSPTSFSIIDDYDRAPDYIETRAGRMKRHKSDFMKYVTGDAVGDWLLCINTAVHETCHSYTLVKSYEVKDRAAVSIPGYGAYCLGTNDIVFVKTTPVFRTEEIAETIPDALRTFRFKTYVTGARIGANVGGVYGLLDEYHAYYHGNKASFDLYPWYRDRMEPGPEKWHRYFLGVNGSFSAGMEFKFFIVKYLQYARARHPRVYRDIMGNGEFLTAFRGIEKNHTRLAADYFRVKEEIYAALRTEGYTVSEDEKHYYVGKDCVREGLSHNLETHFLLSKELEKEEYREILRELNAGL